MWPESPNKNVFHQFDFVDKSNLETKNTRRDTNILSVSAGLVSAVYSNVATLMHISWLVTVFFLMSFVFWLCEVTSVYYLL